MRALVLLVGWLVVIGFMLGAVGIIEFRIYIGLP